jgi:hypothetical protein
MRRLTDKADRLAVARLRRCLWVAQQARARDPERIRDLDGSVEGVVVARVADVEEDGGREWRLVVCTWAGSLYWASAWREYRGPRLGHEYEVETHQIPVEIRDLGRESAVWVFARMGG